jgi:uncharacterized protein YjbJ (UPF0337 family)
MAPNIESLANPAIGTFTGLAPLLGLKTGVRILRSRFARTSVLAQNKECVMDWNRIEGNWKQFKGRAKEKWGRLTDDDLDVINGRQDQLEGKIQERYGFAKDQAKKDVEDWFSSLR